MTTAKERSQRWRENNRDRYNSYFKEWHKAHPDKRAEYRKRRISEGRESVMNENRSKREYKINNRWKQYGLSNDDFYALFKSQDERCAICGNILILDGDAKERPHVDHDHQTGLVRGLLCSTCNCGLGMFRDNPVLLELAKEYVVRGAK